MDERQEGRPWGNSIASIPKEPGGMAEAVLWGCRMEQKVKERCRVRGVVCVVSVPSSDGQRGKQCKGESRAEPGGRCGIRARAWCQLSVSQLLSHYVEPSQPRCHGGLKPGCRDRRGGFTSATFS